ncbi:hypothetical protein, partial [Stenotrophomonas indicatrix]|uniref:hypothetical protein n=1 Tax=Stenotrophomonas indicatrix TaxID=2045451 RepID=UPI001AA1ABD3
WRHGWRHRAPKDGFTACPANPTRPAKHGKNPEPLLTLLLLLPWQYKPAAGSARGRRRKENP